MTEILSGTIERVTFHNPENGFCVLKVHVRGRLGLVSVIGNSPMVTSGEHLEAEGNWEQDRDHGPQFKALAMRCTAPHSIQGIEKYLGSGLIKGIGPTYAKKIVEAFGVKTLQILDESPSYLKEVRGLGPKRIEKIRQSWKEQKTVRDIMIFLQSNGIGTSRALRIYKTYGSESVSLIRENPYRLARDIWGVGFQTADDLALKIGIDRLSLDRAGAALLYTLEKGAEEGHVGVPRELLLKNAEELTCIPPNILEQSLERELGNGALVGEDIDGVPWIYAVRLHQSEVLLAKHMLRLIKGNHPLAGLDVRQKVQQIVADSGLELDDKQSDAVEMAAASKVLILTGGPGVGKTTIIRLILQLFQQAKKTCVLCAPTGRAARRLSESTSQEAKTIHRTLEFDPSVGGFRKDSSQPLEGDLFVVDETSMVDTVLMAHLVRAIPNHACLLLVGDVDQLPSVGPGRVLADLIESRKIPTARLTRIFRQAGVSLIVRAAHSVLHGELPVPSSNPKGDYFFVEAEQPQSVAEKILTMIHDRIPKTFQFDPLRDIQVLTPMNRTELGAQEFNKRIQELLNPPGKVPQIERFGVCFRLGDKVIQLRNNYQKEVFNGDVGFVEVIDEEERELMVSFDGRRVAYEYGELDEIGLAYALTIHKSQGSEYPVVVLPLHTQHFLMLQRNLLYTAITRGKKLVVVVGTRKALEIAISRQDNRHRYTSLILRLYQKAAH
ncbi:MAG: ATP-dependent RecD-like DNA helicase [Gemmataceae bacterium]